MIVRALVSIRYSTTENTRSLRVAFWKNDGTTQMYGCKCSFEKEISIKYSVYTQFMAANVLLK